MNDLVRVVVAGSEKGANDDILGGDGGDEDEEEVELDEAEDNEDSADDDSSDDEGDERLMAAKDGEAGTISRGMALGCWVDQD